MRATFFRNVANEKMLLEYSNKYAGLSAKYKIIATLIPDLSEYISFCNSFQTDCGFLQPYIDEAIIVNGIWRCVAITNTNNTILAVMDHYHYPRFLAIANT